jgi:hypothetical protein
VALAIIYFVGGFTFLAIRVGVRDVPPFLLAAMRYLVAGLVLYGCMSLKGERSPTGRHWASASLLAILIFALLTLALKRKQVPSALQGQATAYMPSDKNRRAICCPPIDGYMPSVLQNCEPLPASLPVTDK